MNLAAGRGQGTLKGAVVARGVRLTGPTDSFSERILTTEALEFVAGLHRRFEPVRQELLLARQKRQAAFDHGTLPDFLAETRSVRDESWTVASAPADLKDRRVEITGPTDRKMMINALNSGAKVFMADFEDANAPTWRNMVEGQANLVEAVKRTLAFDAPDGRQYRLNPKTATLVVRPRGWHLPEKHLQVDGGPMSGSLFDVGVYLFHNAKKLVARGTGPYVYLPKIESHLEARLWAQVFAHAETELKLAPGTIRATVLIETVTAAFEMDEILYELRAYGAALNAGRWDYLFSIIKKFRNRPEFVLPDRARLTMTTPFMCAYTELLVKTCHRRGAFAIGGMAAYIPSRKDPEVNERALEAVRADKLRESGDGFDGTWVAHPDLVPVAMEVFDKALGKKPNQLARRQDEVAVGQKDLLNVKLPGAQVTRPGLRANIGVGLRYLASWLEGVGAAAIFNLMEDTATAEIARSQIWQWTRHGSRIEDGTPINADLVRTLVGKEIRDMGANGGPGYKRLNEARELFEQVAIGPEYVEFLTLPGYEMLEGNRSAVR